MKRHQRLQVSYNTFFTMDLLSHFIRHKLTLFIYHICFYVDADNSNVVSVFLSKEYKLHTTRSWDFLGLEKDGGISLDSAWWKARFGEDTIMANLDSG